MINETKKSMNESQKEKIFSKEHRKKLSEAKKGKNHPFYGKFGRDHPSYKNGFTFNKIIAKQFLESKNYTCECCGFQELLENKIGKKSLILAHHIISREDAPKKINDFDNLSCLCISCHQKYHIWNISNINRRSLMEFIKETGKIL